MHPIRTFKPTPPTPKPNRCDNNPEGSYLHGMADEVRAIRYHIQQFNRLCDAAGYTGDKLESPDDLQSRISQEINWLDV